MNLSIPFLIEHFAYFGIVIALIGGMVGLPIPDEILLTYVGYTVYQGHLLLFPSLIVSILGAMGGITVSYLLGYKLGLPFIKKFGHKIHITEKRLHYSGKLFKKMGSYLLFIGFFIPGVRHITAYLAAVHGYSFKRFSLFAFSGAIVWVSTFIILGNVLGSKWMLVEFYVKQLWMVFLPLLIVLAICVIVIYRKKITLKQNA
ncbi:DedA family protein [Bacillus sp. AP8]|uniref:DedA family protein n=1 Tax=Bacillus sp. AP8 TaxID=1513284 RepID=UPI0002FFAACE|nr:DedA family protein [Bacillus sp. AP8]